MTDLLHYGLQRSGTNILQQLIQGRFKDRLLNDNADRSHPLHKHFRPNEAKAIVPEPRYANTLSFPGFADFQSAVGDRAEYYLVISKDPYAWLLSYRRWAEQCQWLEPDHHYIEEYGAFYGAWMKFAKQSDRIIFIRYMDLIQDQASELKRIASRARLRRKFFGGSLGKPLRYVPQSSKFGDSRKKYYLERRYLDDYESADIEQVNRMLDPELMAFLGYDISAPRSH